MSSIDTLAELLAKLPGIGPRQARRIVYYLLTQNYHTLERIADAIKDLKKETKKCVECGRFFPIHSHANTECTICVNPNRDTSKLMLVEKDVDVEAFEKSGVYDGKYFVLGGTVTLFEKNPKDRLALLPLKKYLEKHGKDLSEFIFALSATPSGEETAAYVFDDLKEVLESLSVSISKLGRGLSTGSELEYADSDTIKNAFERRQ